MIKLSNINRILQNNTGGIKTLEITDVSNPTFAPTVESGAPLLVFPFKRGTCKLTGSGKTGSGGYYSRLNIYWKRSKRDVDVQKLRSLLGNVKFAIRVTDFNGVQTVILPATIADSYDSGYERVDDNLYSFVATGVDLFRSGHSAILPDTGPINPNPNSGQPIPHPENGPSEEDLIFLQYQEPDETGPAPTEQFTTATGNPCANILINPFQDGNYLNANISGAPVGYTLSIKKEGVEVATGLPYTVTESGIYIIDVITPDCTKSKSYQALFTDPVTDFTISIDVNGNTLTAITDAAAATYDWELETDTDVKVIGHGPTAEISKVGLYRLTITENGESKSVYHLHLTPDVVDVNVVNIGALNYTYRLTDHYNKVSGHIFDPVRIDISQIINPREQLKAYRGGDLLKYVDNAPGEVNEWSIINGKYQTWSAIPLVNEDFLVEYNKL